MVQFTPDKAKDTHAVSLALLPGDKDNTSDTAQVSITAWRHMSKGRLPPQMHTRYSKLVPLAKHALAAMPEITAQAGHVISGKKPMAASLLPPWLGLCCTPVNNPKTPTAPPTPIHRSSAKTP